MTARPAREKWRLASDWLVAGGGVWSTWKRDRRLLRPPELRRLTRMPQRRRWSTAKQLPKHTIRQSRRPSATSESYARPPAEANNRRRKNNKIPTPFSLAYLPPHTEFVWHTRDFLVMQQKKGENVYFAVSGRKRHSHGKRMKLNRQDIDGLKAIFSYRNLQI